jgi:hypothetical protein
MRYFYQLESYWGDGEWMHEASASSLAQIIKLAARRKRKARTHRIIRYALNRYGSGRVAWEK